MKMNLMKKVLIYGIVLFWIFNLSTCGKEEGSEDFTPFTVNALGWEFTIEDIQINDSLNDISTTVGYGGASSSTEIIKEPESGKTFALIKMVVEKKEGSETIEWENLALLDSKGNTYSRLNDSFLEDFGIKRMKGTTLSFGRNEGWITFEIDADSSVYKLEYESNGRVVSIDLTK